METGVSDQARSCSRASMGLCELRGVTNAVTVTVRQRLGSPQNNDYRLIHACLGSTFEFRRKKLVGSYLVLSATKRERLLPKTASAEPLPAWLW